MHNISKLFYHLSALYLFFAIIFNTANAGMWDQFIDKKDGMFDASTFVLDNATGFMPLPIIITEPALGGFGAGAALAFFHESEEEKARRLSGEIEELDLPPSVSGAVAAYTVNDSWFGAGFRYLIMRLLKARVGLDIARGPEETAYYLTFGSAWSMD